MGKKTDTFVMGNGIIKTSSGEGKHQIKKRSGVLATSRDKKANEKVRKKEREKETCER